MEGTSKVIMGSTLVMVMTLAIVLGLILVLLAELYCSLLRRRRQHKTNSYSNTVADSADGATAAPHLPSTQQSQDHSTGPSLGSFLGILCAPRSFLSPPVSSKEEDCAGTKKQHSQLLQVFDILVKKCYRTHLPCHIGIIMSIPSPSISFVTSPQPTPDDKVSPGHGANCNEKAGGGSSGCGGGASEHFVYISNPIYDNEAIGRASGTNTPFQTPDMSPSRMKMGGSSSSSSGDEEVAQPIPSGPSNPITTPPLTPMKKLPAEALFLSEMQDL